MGRPNKKIMKKITVLVLTAILLYMVAVIVGTFVCANEAFGKRYRKYPRRSSRCCSDYYYHSGGHQGITHGEGYYRDLADWPPGFTEEFPNYIWVQPDWERAPTRGNGSKIIVDGIVDE